MPPNHVLRKFRRERRDCRLSLPLRRVADLASTVFSRTHRKIAGVATLALCVSCFMIAGCKSSEPRHNGRPLTEWLGVVTYPPISGPLTNNPADIAVHAVEAIGTNGVPTFLRLIRARDSERAKHLNKYGLTGFAILRTNAQIAVPSLLTDLQSSDPGVRERASVALDLIGYQQHRGSGH